MSGISVVSYRCGDNKTYSQGISYGASREEFQKANNLAVVELLKTGADIYCLQGRLDDDHELIVTLKANRYTVIFPPKVKEIHHTAIAVKTKSFDDVKNHHNLSFIIHLDNNKKTSVACVKLTNSRNDQLAILSIRVPKKNSMEKYCTEVATEALKKISDCNMKIIGANMNCSPEKHPTYFEKFTSQDFKIIRTNVPTKVSSQGPRETDFIFANVNDTSTFQNLLSKLRIISSGPNARILLPFTLAQNPSQHTAIAQIFQAEDFPSKATTLPPEAFLLVVGAISVIAFSIIAATRL